MRRPTLIALLVGIVCAAFLAGTPRADNGPDLRGVWTLVSLTEEGKPVAMNAMMILTKQYYARVTVEKNRPKFEGFDFRKPEALTPEQLRLVAFTFPRSNSNGGTYRVEGDMFLFTATAHQNPNAEGQDFRRRIALTGTRLKMIQESGQKAEEVWERVEEGS
jgi:hypothetical protein